MSCDIDGSSQVETRDIVRARKAHACCACDEPIRPGDRYMRHFVLYDRHPQTYKQCLRCSALFEHLLDTHVLMDDQGVAIQLDCGHSYEEIHGEPPSEDIARLAFLTADEIQALYLAPEALA